MRRAIAWAAPAAPAGLILLGASQLAGGAWIHAKAVLAQLLLEHAWRRTLDGEERVRPWPWADTWPVARLTLPRLDTTSIVLAGATGRTLAFGPGHTQGSALPGEIGTSIVSGHRDTHFRALREVRRGEIVVIERPDGEVVRYSIAALEVADARRARVSAAGGDTSGRWCSSPAGRSMRCGPGVRSGSSRRRMAPLSRHPGSQTPCNDGCSRRNEQHDGEEECSTGQSWNRRGRASDGERDRIAQ